jgi:hypothetical protein
VVCGCVLIVLWFTSWSLSPIYLNLLNQSNHFLFLEINTHSLYNQTGHSIQVSIWQQISFSHGLHIMLPLSFTISPHPFLSHISLNSTKGKTWYHAFNLYGVSQQSKTFTTRFWQFYQGKEYKEKQHSLSDAATWLRPTVYSICLSKWCTGVAWHCMWRIYDLETLIYWGIFLVLCWEMKFAFYNTILLFHFGWAERICTLDRINKLDVYFLSWLCSLKSSMDNGSTCNCK